MTEIVRLYNREGDGMEPQADLGPDGRLIRGDEDFAQIAIEFLEEFGVDELLTYLDGPHLMALAIDVEDLDYDPGLQEKRYPDEPQTEKGYRLSKDWIRYRGPFGGEGWQHVQTGDVRYTEEPPGEVAEGAEGQVQTTLPGEDYELTNEIEVPDWMDVGTAREIAFRVLPPEAYDDFAEYDRENFGSEGGTEMVAEAAAKWIAENADGETAQQLREEFQQYQSSPWGETDAPEHLNPSNAETLTPLQETEAHAGVSARSMMIGEMESGDRIFITNVNDDVPGGMGSEGQDEAISAEQTSKFLDALGETVPEHHYEQGEYLAVAEAQGRPLDSPGRNRVSTGEFASFAATQLLIGNGDAHQQNVFEGWDGLICIDLDLAGNKMKGREVEWALGKLFDSAVHAGVYEPYDDDEKDQFVEDIRQELEYWVEGDAVDEALESVDDGYVREIIEWNIQKAREGELISEDQRIRAGL